MAKRRKTATRDVKPVFRIYTEGQESEINYIAGYIKDYLNSKGVFDQRITAEKPKNHSPYGLLTTAKENMVSGDDVWIVFDRDGHDKIPETFCEAKDFGINIAYSSICFETWILLHFTYTTKSFSSYDDLKNKQIIKHIPGYEKAVKDLFAVATQKNGLANARRNAKKLCLEMIKNNPGTPIDALNPYTNVHELLDAIDQFIANMQK